METTKLIFYILAVLTYASYRFYIRKLDIKSISESFYELEGWHKYLFVAFCFLLGIEMFGAVQTGWTFGGMAGMGYIGVAPNYKQNVTGTAHYFGAVLAIACSLGSIAFDFGLWKYSLLLIPVFGLVAWTCKRKFLIIEDIAIISILAVVGYNFM